MQNDTFRRDYKTLTIEAQEKVKATKDKAAELLELFRRAPKNEDLRIAEERLIEALMWSTRAHTAYAFE